MFPVVSLAHMMTENDVDDDQTVELMQIDKIYPLELSIQP